jgi:hypothetical protein
MEHKNKPIDGGRPITSRLKVTSQNVRLPDPVIREKAIGSLVLAHLSKPAECFAPWRFQSGLTVCGICRQAAHPEIRIQRFLDQPNLGYWELVSPSRGSIPQHRTHGAPPRSRIRCPATLLGHGVARHRPQPCARAAYEQDRNDPWMRQKGTALV